MKYYIGVDIGGTKCAVILGRTNGDKVDLIEREVFPTDTIKGPEYNIDKFYKCIDLVLERNNLESTQLSGIGINCGGPLDSRRGLILSPPNLIGWDNVPIVEMFSKRFNVRTKLQNDANAGALAEHRFGAAKGYENVVFLTFGTGMGAGLILNGKLYDGANGMAGEVGHMRLETFGPIGYGKSGSFEGFCSGGGIAQIARTRVLEELQKGKKVKMLESIQSLDELNAGSIAMAAEEGDELAKEIYEISGRYLGRGLSIIIDLFNPEIIVIGSIFARCRELLWPSALEVILKESIPMSAEACRVVPAGLGEKIGDYEALAIAMMN